MRAHYPTIDIEDFRTLWPSGRGEAFAYILEDIDAMALSFRVPILVEKGNRFLLFASPKLGAFTAIETETGDGRRAVELILDAFLPWELAKAELPDFFSEAYEIKWLYDQPPNFDRHWDRK